MMGHRRVMGECRVKTLGVQSESAGERDKVQMVKNPEKQLLHKSVSNSCTIQGIGLGQCRPLPSRDRMRKGRCGGTE